MRLLHSPLAFAAMSEDVDRKLLRAVPLSGGEAGALTFTVNDPSEGLAGLYWRNFFGPPFIHMFGDRLGQLPAGARQELGDDIAVVQPYALPTAGTQLWTCANGGHGAGCE